MSTTVPTLTYDDLIRRATEIWSEDRRMVFTANTTDFEAVRIASRAVTAAIDLWCDETGANHTDIPEAMKIIAMARIIRLGWEEWERETQLDMFRDEDIWRGAAAHEARRDLG